MGPVIPPRPTYIRIDTHFPVFFSNLRSRISEQQSLFGRKLHIDLDRDVVQNVKDNLEVD
jgi:hypothetical protein